MGSIISFLETLPFKLITFIKGEGWQCGFFYRSNVSGLTGNSFVNTGCFVHSKLSVNGTGNKIIQKGYLQYTTIEMFGNDNIVQIEDGCTINGGLIFVRATNAKLLIGRNTSIMSGIQMICQGNGNYISIGCDCLFSENIDIWNSDTHTITDTTGNIINPSKPVVVDNHVWLGKNVSVLKGVHIGKNTVVGMSSIVSKSLPENSICVGNPAQSIKSGISWSKEMHQETIFL